MSEEANKTGAIAGNFKTCSEKQLEELAARIRAALLDAVKNNGGHLSANLGAVELILALYRVFDFPRDKLIFDVGHQSYTHKLLTGRDLASLREKGGPSGFPDPEESEYDAFIAGHSGTSVAAGIGFCAARDLRGENYKVVSFIGDASLGNGEALEAFFSSETKPRNFLVVLNDNGMSISKNQSALYRSISKLTAKRRYRNFNSFLGKTFKETSAFGRRLRRLKYTVKGWLNKNDFFERCGFKYIGPVNGHDLHELVGVLANIRSMNEPVLLHAVTVKGKGFEAAEEDPARFHGVGRNFCGAEHTFSAALGALLCDRAEKDPTLVAVTAAMTDGVGLAPFAEKFPSRCFDAGICEEYAVTMAAGMAKGGLSPVVCLYSTFLQRAFDQIVHDVCLQNLPVLFCVDRAGLVGADGKTHQGLLDLPALRAVPNLRIFAPKDAEELADVFDYARSLRVPAVIRYPNGGASPLGSYSRIGADSLWEVLRAGGGPVVLACGARAAARALRAADLSGTDAQVVNCRCVRPLDERFLDAAAGRILVTFEEGYVAGGFGSAVAEYYAARSRCVRLTLIGAPGVPVAHASAQQQAESLGLTAEALAERLRTLAKT